MPRHLLTIALALIAAACTPEAPKAPSSEPEALRGALRGPAAAMANATVSAPGDEVTLYDSPTATAGRTLARDGVEHDWGHEGDDREPIIYIAYGQTGNRYKVRVGESFYWIDAKVGARFMTPRDFWTSRMAYLSFWDGQLAEAPGGPGRASPARAKIEPPAWVHDTAIRVKDQRELMASLPPGWLPMDAPIEVLDAQVMEGEVWLKVQLIDVGPCEREPGAQPVIFDTGWVRQRAPLPYTVVAALPGGC
ncbi:MAG: hypothetical protein ACOYJ6_07315 [Caulobacterales bacterium]|jgi:hypothetical protein